MSSTGGGASPQPIALTNEEQAAIARLFEGGPSLFGLLSTLRTRRMGHGYRSETGEDETFDWSSRATVRQAEGPLAYASQARPVPLSEVEEAAIAWAALGPNGIIAADVPVQGDLSSLLYWAGRTVPGSSNDMAVDLFIINDQGTFLYRPGPARLAPVEIRGPEDYWKILHWYRNCRTKISDRRPDVGWFTAPPGTHNVNTMGALQYNMNRPGSTWFLPVGDVGLEWVTLLLSSYQFSGFYLQDPNTDKPAGCDQWIRPGFLEVGFPLPTFDELALMLHASEAACAVQNIRLACEALGLGAWAMGGYSDDLLLGAYPEVARGLGFSFLERDPARNPSKTATCQGLPGVLDAAMTPSPAFPTAEALVRHVAGLRYARGAQLAREDNWASASGGPFRGDVLERILEHPRAHIPDWVIEAAIDTVQYVVEHFGCAPAYVNPVRAKFSAQVHHVDLAYYRRFHAAGDAEPFLITPRIRDHFATWHPGVPDPSL
ncbi:MAG: hypothetical protein IT304_11065 [Dehalococcoidia bacterium]|nr:hypothetical protein [Dehalococcoidia bacterium]